MSHDVVSAIPSKPTSKPESLMPTNKNALLRYHILDQCFSDFRHRYSIHDLLDKVNETFRDLYGTEVSLRQIREDIRHMRDRATYNAPIETYPLDGRKSYYRYADTNFSIFNDELTTEEVASLRAMINMLGRFRGVLRSAWLDEVISNLEWRLGLNEKQENIIGFEQNPYLRGLPLLPEIIDATANHQAILISYKSYKDGQEEHTLVVHPWYVKQYNNRWFLMAYDGQADRICNYALDRIRELRVAEDVPFIPNKTTDFDHYFDDVFGVTIPPPEIEKIRVVMQFSEKQYPYITSKPIHHSQTIVDADNHIIAVELRPTYEFTQLVLSFGPDIKVLEPESYKREIVEDLRRTLKNYQSVQIDCTD